MTALFLLLLLSILAFLALMAWRTRTLARQAVEAVPMVGRLIPVEGGAIHHLELGDPKSPALVMIHGLSGQLQHFSFAMAQELARDFRVILLDRPGCGYSHRDSDDLASPNSQAQMIWRFLDAINISDPAVVGHSLGGAVALAMALERPGQIHALALLAPLTHPMATAPESFKGLRIRSPFLRRFLGHTLAVPAAKRTAVQVLADIFAPEPCPDAFLTEAGAALGLRPKAFVTASADIIAAEQAIPQMSKVYAQADLPTGAVLFGEMDAILSPQTHGDPMQHHGFTLQLLPGRGHMLPITAPAESVRFVRETVLFAKNR